VAAAAPTTGIDPGRVDHDHVLGLTVHGLPAPGPALAESEQAARRTRVGRWKMLMVLLVCAAPVVASYFTYYVIRPEGRRNFGELINPQRTVPQAQAVDLSSGQAVPLDSLKGQWLLLSVGGGACDEACQQRLYFQRQLREGMGREKDRIDWVWLVNDAQPLPDTLTGLKQATVLRVPPEVVSGWLTPATGHALEDHIYVVDPMGNWMMRFPAPLTMDNAPKSKRDLERLLRASSSWDKEGRELAGH
jgi:hypothetical protein